MPRRCGLLALAALTVATRRCGAHSVETLAQLKAELHTLTPAEADARLAALPPSPTPPHQDKIDHFVVLFMENQATDVFTGCMDRPGLDSIRNATIPKDPTCDLPPSPPPWLLTVLLPFLCLAFCWIFVEFLRAFACSFGLIFGGKWRSSNKTGGSYTFKCQKEYICTEVRVRLGPLLDSSEPPIDPFGPHFDPSEPHFD